jgi:hypothetical protein
MLFQHAGRVLLKTGGLILLCALVSSLAMTPAYAQVKSAGISGSVVDSGKAVIAGAEITVTEQATRTSQKSLSDGAGQFTVPYLSAGIYTVEIQKQGFKAERVAAIVLTEGQQYQLNVQLSVGSASETVNVSSEAAQLQTETPQVDGTIAAQVIESIPNTNQNPLYYATLQAGVVGRSELSNTQTTTSFGIGYDGRRTFSAIAVNGGSAFTNDIQLDGLSVLGSGWNESTVMPNTDALQEVRIVTNDYAADLGRGQAVIQMATKSGTNRFDFTVYDRIRNEAFNANSFGNNYQGIPRPAFKVNDFGGTAGGPVLHNKLFIFTSFEELLHTDAPQWEGQVPTALERTGDFSQTFEPDQNGAKAPVHIFNPFDVVPSVQYPNVYERQPYAQAGPGLGPIIPNPPQQALNIMSIYPLPNHAPTDDYQSNNFLITRRRTFNRSSSNSRLDYHLSDRQSLYVSGGVEMGQIKTPSPYGVNSPYYFAPPGSTEPALVQDDNPYVSLGDTITLNPTTVVDVRLGVERVDSNFLASGATNFSATDYGNLGIPTSVQSHMVLPGSAPDLYAGVGGASGGRYLPISNTQYNNKRERQTNTQVTGSITKIHGRWSFKEGAEYRVSLANYNDFEEAAAAYGFTGNPTARYIDVNGNGQGQNNNDYYDGGFQGASVLTGIGGWYTGPGNGTRLALAQKYTAIYSQNDWHPSPKVTVNFGLRWEVQPGPTDRDNRIGVIDQTKTNAFGTLGEIVFPGHNGLSRNAWKTNWDGYQPRVGASYRVRNNLVLRGGYGISFQPNNTGWYDGPYNYGTAALITGTNWKEYGLSPDGVPVGHFYDAAATIINPAAGLNSAAPGIYGAGNPYFDYNNMQPPRIQQWNIFVERQLTPTWLASIGYVGSHGDHLEFAGYPIDNDQSIPQATLNTWEQAYIATGNNPGNQQVQNPLQPTTGPLLPFRNGLGNATISQDTALFPHLALWPNSLDLDNGGSNYNSLVAQVQHAFSSGFSMMANYVWSRSSDSSYTALQDRQGFSDVDGGSGVVPVDLRDKSNNTKISYTDIPQRFVGVVTYRLPFGTNDRFAPSNAALRAVTGGWSFGAVQSLQAGLPAPPDLGGMGGMNGLAIRTNEPLVLPKTYQHWYDGATSVTLPDGRNYTPPSQSFLKFNPDAFAGRVTASAAAITAQNPTGVVQDIYWNGNSKIDYSEMRGPGVNNLNLSLARTFRITERASFSFSAQMSNALNHTQFSSTGYSMGEGSPITVPVAGSGSAVGEPDAGNYGTHGLGTADPRQVVFEGRIHF